MATDTAASVAMSGESTKLVIALSLLLLASVIATLNKRVIALGLVLLFAGGVIGAVAVAVRDGDGDDGDVAGPSTTTSSTQPLNETAEQLVDRLAGARDREVHIVFDGALKEPPGAKLTVEVWWKGDLARQSLVAEAPGQGRQETVGFVLEDRNVLCQRNQDVDWVCQRAASTVTAEGRDAGIIESLVSSLNGKDVTAAKADVAGSEADCYTLDKDTGDMLCLREDGVPVKFTFSGTELVASKVETDVDDDAFEPPAKVQDPPAPSTTATTGG
ncbi:MAG: hypothetical protein ACRD0N_12235 [Acidimicrobiales bacterium]